MLSPNQSGSIEVITGPMFSGKSEELIRRVRRAQIARLNTVVFKHCADDRFSADHVVSHSDWRLRSHGVKSAEEILSCLDHNVHVVGIDEAQFFDGALVNVVRTLAERGTRVLVAGLDLDYLGQPFGPMPQLLAVADEVTKLQAVCVQCGQAAHFSQRVVPSAERVIIGATDAYEARCRRCFIPGVDVPTASNASAPRAAGAPPLSASNEERDKGEVLDATVGDSPGSSFTDSPTH